MSENEQTTQKPDWAGIIRDMLILVGVMGALGYLCNLAMKPFEVQTPTDNLVSLIRKGGVKDGVDKPFTKELQDGLASHKEFNFVNIPDGTGRTPLMWAVYTHTNDPAAAWREDAKRVFYVKALMDVPGIDVEARDNDGFTALHWAAWSGMPQSTFLLTQRGLEVNAVEKHGYTPLMLAALRGNAPAVKLLLVLGADPSLKNADGKTALDMAKEKGDAYEKRDTAFFSLIYHSRRHEQYNEAIALLQNPPAKAENLTEETVREKMEDLVNKADAEDEAESAATADETKGEEQAEEAAAEGTAE